MNEHRASDGLTRPDAAAGAERSSAAIAWMIASMILLAPVPFGSVALWSQAALFVAATVLVGLWLVGALRAGAVVWTRSWAWPVLAACIGLVLLQCVPLPGGVVAGLSPESAWTHDSASSGGSLAQATLSVAPHATETGLFRWSMLAAVFLVAAQALTRRFHLVIVLVAVVAVAALELALGGIRLATDPGRVLWNAPTLVSRTLAGTFLDANRLAGLLAVALGVSMGLWMAAFGSRRGGIVRPALLAVAVAFGLGVALTRSHSGLIAALVTVFLFLLMVGFAAKLRLRTLALFAVIALVLCVGQFIALEFVLAWMEQTAPTPMAAVDWADRVDLHRSAWSLLATYPILGSGLGSFGAVFPRFQSARFGDRVAEHPHDDWLTLACETGVVGFLLVALLVVLVVAPTLKRGLRRTDPSARWLTAGALAGASALLVQSAFDAALLHVPAFGVILAALLGAGFAAARMPGIDQPSSRAVRVVPLGPVPVRLGLGLLIPVVLAVVALHPVGRGTAEVIMNRGLAAWGEAADRHHFLPLPAPVSTRSGPGADTWVACARGLDPGNPRLARLAARAVERRINAELDARARRYAVELLRSLGEATADPTALAAALRPRVERELLTERTGAAAERRTALDTAVRLAPTSAWDRLARARFLLEVERNRAHREAAGRDASTAMALAPSTPAVLYQSGRVLLDLAASPESRDGNASSGRLAMAAGGFRRALSSWPAFTDAVYDLLLGARGSPRSLFEATPDRPEAYARLVDRLIAERAWPEALAALDGLDRLDRLEAVIPSGLELPRPEAFTDRRRALVHERMGDWRRRSHAVARYRQRLAEALVLPVASADEMAASGRALPALLAYREVLGLDRAHPGALLGLARLLQHPDTQAMRRLAPEPLVLLDRLVTSAVSANRMQLIEAAGLARRATGSHPEQVARARRIEATALRRAGRPREGLAVLADGLVGPNDLRVVFERGRCAQACGDAATARHAFRFLLSRAPGHRAARLALVDLETGERETGPLAPPVRHTTAPDFVRTEIDFAGRLNLVGFRLLTRTTATGTERLVTVWEVGHEPFVGAEVVVEVLGVGDHVLGRVTRSLAARGANSMPAGVLIECTTALPARGGVGLRIAARVGRVGAVRTAPVPTDADEPWLVLHARTVE